MSSVSSSKRISAWNELKKFSNLKENQKPSLYNGKLSDPTSWSQWICSCCCKDKDPVNVNEHLNKMTIKIGDTLKNKEKKLDDVECEIVCRAIENFGKLAILYGFSHERDIKNSSSKKESEVASDLLHEKCRIIIKLTEMGDKLAGDAIENSSYVRYAREHDLLKKRV